MNGLIAAGAFVFLWVFIMLVGTGLDYAWKKYTRRQIRKQVDR